MRRTPWPKWAVLLCSGGVLAAAVLGVSPLAAAPAASDPAVEISFSGHWTIDNIAVIPASRLATRSEDIRGGPGTSFSDPITMVGPFA